MRKALAEAKVHTSWINPDTDYEGAVVSFVDRILDPVVSAKFLADLEAFAARVAFFGRINSLAQTLIRCTAPGVPDTYQGTEAWDLSLVDPDNRRPVDYNMRVDWLRDLDERSVAGERSLSRLASELSRHPSDPRTKLFVTALALRCRRDHSTVFSQGSYDPLSVTGERASHVFAFQRSLNGVTATVIVPRLIAGLVPAADRVPIGQRVWSDTTVSLQGGSGTKARNVFTGEIVATADQLAVGEALGVFPVALLMSV